MRIKYFRDTDTALLELLDAPVDATREINEDVYVDLDAMGNVVSITIEHARRNAQFPNVSVQEFDRRSVRLSATRPQPARRARTSQIARCTPMA
jgi:uncharacterized protein YuzE